MPTGGHQLDEKGSIQSCHWYGAGPADANAIMICAMRFSDDGITCQKSTGGRYTIADKARCRGVCMARSASSVS